ncbi:TIGR03943 family protein [Halalkalibacter sp. AB-rgal2]|uniref:TIGR03943 family putative permease subunit n=1 Tax=Halalkalibacter sp. AB-rgal2 TaxID=3242695 RepID=UPI00359D97E9
MKNNQSDTGFHAYIRGIILIGFALLMLAFLMTGNITYYIAPTMFPLIYFATAVFLILGILQIIRSTKKGQEEEQLCDCGTDHSVQGPFFVKLIIYTIFITPIVLGFVLPDRLLDSSVAANRGVQFGSGLVETTPVAQEPANSSSTSRAEAFLDDPEAYYAELENHEGADSISNEEFYTEEGYNQYYSELASELLEEDTVIVTEENYLDVMTILDLHLNDFIGKSIETVGFVFQEDDFDDDQFVVARFGMTCCIADASVYGTMVRSDEPLELDNDTWVRVSGIIGESTYGEMRIPQIMLRGFEIIEAPDSPYVYPRFSF